MLDTINNCEIHSGAVQIGYSFAARSVNTVERKI